MPKHFEFGDPHEIASFIRTHSFGTLVSSDAGEPRATHLPFVFSAEMNVLFTHMAKANPQWEQLENRPVLAIFSGPHAYISPSWYETPDSVPTWNYQAVHLHGTCRVIRQEEELAVLLEKTVHFYEPDSSLPLRSDEFFYRNMMKAIVGLRIDVTSVAGAAKLSQNKPKEVQRRVYTQLVQSEDAGAKGIAKLMQERIERS